MSQTEIKRLVEARLPEPGMVETGVPGMRLFRVEEPVRCAPAVYEPTVVAIVGGTKEAVLDGTRHVYGADRYLVCPLPLPVEAGTPLASPDAPLLGVQIMLDARVMTDLVLAMDRAGGGAPSGPAATSGLALAPWDDAFAEALLRLVRLADRPAEAAVLGEGRVRELCHAVLMGGAGTAARRAYGIGNGIARAIEHLASRLDEPVTIDDMAARAHMSRAVFHRRFKEATRQSPIQFAKAMRLNAAAMRIASGTTVSAAAADVGYASPSQFSREFRRAYGRSPRDWRGAGQPGAVM
ncbi:AraC family transcriptional regulator [Jannaschia sp. Os4]|uniref:AraC family transcriptional regulator n=1 Tax=Jannaschia sp. Os4 TaxID=2807617 RepID=UPI001939A017|nr:AraC family transcriptional regulator [Jannaschia sp. Os4]MBM2576349.1 AraC family transcriptional regulator [Jannaschia sp. Os4]